tara:strand:+ start:892 stop:1416 length:525 start_codon:yes stop_codon:yes gene_type:complete
MNKNLLVFVGVVLGYLIGWLLFPSHTKAEGTKRYATDQIYKSLSIIPKWKTEQTFIMAQYHGSSTVFEVAKFQCCDTAAMAFQNKIIMGYLNTVETTPIGTTTKKQVPEIEIEILGHELVHHVLFQPYVIEQCPALKGDTQASKELHESIAYNWDYLYKQIRSLDEDGYIRLVK